VVANVRVGIRVATPTYHPYTLNAAQGAFALTGGSVLLLTARGFPQTAISAIGGTQKYNATVQTIFSTYDYAILSSTFDNAEQITGRTFESVALGVKGQCPIGVATKIIRYCNLNEQNPAAPFYASWYSAANTANWWLYNAGTSGTKTPSTYNPSWYLVNMTHNSPQSGGLYPYEVGAQLIYNQFQAGTGNQAASPNTDGWVCDNTFQKWRVTADFLRSGSSQSPTTTTSLNDIRVGQTDFANKLRAIHPSSLAFGNIADWYQAYPPYSAGGSNLGALRGVLNGGVAEGTFADPGTGNYSWAVENQSWPVAMQGYRQNMADTIAPNVVILDYDMSSSTNFQGYRYAICSTLMDNGWLQHFVNGASQDTGAAFPDFDERYGGTINNYKYLGGAIGAPHAGTYTTAIISREFQNGYAVVSPKGSGGGTWTAPVDVWHLRGARETTVNNHAKVTAGSTISLADRDGIIVMKSPT
jgi:hypothetical protein